MKHPHIQQFLFVLTTITVVSGWCASAWSQVDPVVIDIRNRLVEKTSDEYVEARDEALELPQGVFNDLLFLLRLSPDYSLEQILALILETRAEHAEEAARFDADFQSMLDNPDMTGRHGGPIYRIWRSREVKQVHPLVYEAHIKIGVPPMPIGLFGMVSMPNPDRIPFILYLAKHRSPGRLYDLVSATEGHLGEREWLRPLAVQMYKEHREEGNVLGATGVIGMFQSFGTLQDLEILKSLREYEQALMPAQGIVIRDRDEIGREWVRANREHEQRATELARAEREGAAAQILAQRKEALDEAEAAAIEVNRQYYGNMLWRRLDEHIQRLEARLEPAEQND